MLQMYIKCPPAGNDHRAIANSDSVLIAQIFFDEKKKKEYIAKCRSSAKEVRPPVIQKGTNNVSDLVVCACFQVLQRTHHCHIRGLLTMMP